MSATVKADLPAKRETAALEKTQPPDFHALMLFALEKGKTEDLERLVTMRERFEARAAEMEFAEALAAFQGECPPIKKTKAVLFTNQQGAKPAYHYAPLDQIAAKITPFLQKHGFSFSHDATFTDTIVDVVCILRHRNGHKESSRFTAPLDAVSKAMSPQQRNANALSFARRYSLIQVLGLTTTDDDIETPDPAALETITASEVADLEAKIQECGTNKDRLLTLLKLRRLEDMTKADLKRAVDLMVNAHPARSAAATTERKTQAQILLEERRRKGQA